MVSIVAEVAVDVIVLHSFVIAALIVPQQSPVGLALQAQGLSLHIAFGIPCYPLLTNVTTLPIVLGRSGTKYQVTSFTKP